MSCNRNERKKSDRNAKDYPSMKEDPIKGPRVLIQGDFSLFGVPFYTVVYFSSRPDFYQTVRMHSHFHAFREFVYNHRCTVAAAATGAGR